MWICKNKGPTCIVSLWGSDRWWAFTNTVPSCFLLLEWGIWKRKKERVIQPREGQFRMFTLASLHVRGRLKSHVAVALESPLEVLTAAVQTNIGIATFILVCDKTEDRIWNEGFRDWGLVRVTQIFTDSTSSDSILRNGVVIHGNVSRKSLSIWKAPALKRNQQTMRTDINRHEQTRTDMNRHGQTQTDTNRHEHTRTDTDRHQQMRTDMNRHE